MPHSARYRSPADLCVILTLFNLGRSREKLQNFVACHAPLQLSGIPTIVVECAFGDDPWILDLPGVTRLRTLSALWQKERLINCALSQLPDQYTKIAWIDADILLENPDWAVRASELLDDLAVVQLADRFVRLPQDSCEYSGTGQIWESFGAVYAKHPNAMLLGDFGLHGHTGFGWAARRSVLDGDGLYDGCIAGGGDHVMAHAFCGDWESPCLIRMMGSESEWHRHMAGWAAKIYPLVKARVGVVEGAALHLWHGDISSRRHVHRYEALRAANFNPDRDLELDHNGCWHWATNKPSLHASLEKYLAARQSEAKPR